MVLLKRGSKERSDQRRQRRRQMLRRGLHVLPNLFTLGNAFFGFLSIVFSSHLNFVGAAYCIILGALMDMLDGRTARFVGVSSELGMQLDSLCDVISFCLAPAFLMYRWQLCKIEMLGFFACACFLLAGVLRLARFNITSKEQSVFFLGLPTTIAGCFLVTLFLNIADTTISLKTSFLLMVLMVFLAYLMISSVRFPTFKRVAKSWYVLAAISIIASVTVMGLMKVALLFFILYLVVSISYFIFIRRKEIGNI